MSTEPVVNELRPGLYQDSEDEAVILVRMSLYLPGVNLADTPENRLSMLQALKESFDVVDMVVLLIREDQNTATNN